MNYAKRRSEREPRRCSSTKFLWCWVQRERKSRRWGWHVLCIEARLLSVDIAMKHETRPKTCDATIMEIWFNLINSSGPSMLQVLVALVSKSWREFRQISLRSQIKKLLNSVKFLSIRLCLRIARANSLRLSLRRHEPRNMKLIRFNFWVSLRRFSFLPSHQIRYYPRA